MFDHPSPARPARPAFILGAALAIFVQLPVHAAKANPKIIEVDCGKHQSINEALADNAPLLTVKFTGTCAEDVVIARDDVTLEGSDPSATLVGAGSGPTAVGLPPAIAVTGASRVNLRNFTVSDADRRGVEVRAGSRASLQQMRLVRSVSHGLIVLGGSSVQIADSTCDGNGGDGIGVWESSSLVLKGTVSASHNSRVGIIASTGSSVTSDILPTSVIGNDNLEGFAGQFAASFQLSDVQAKNNRMMGIELIGGAIFSATASVVDGNPYGIVSDHGIVDLGVATVTNNEIGVYGDSAAHFALSGSGAVSITGNTDTGFYLEAGTAYLRGDRIENNGAGGDVVLAFGAQMSFAGANTVGRVECDGSVLTRGSPGCPAAAALNAWRSAPAAVAVPSPSASARRRPQVSPFQP